MKPLYISYFGIEQDLVQNQVLPYLRRLTAGGVGMGLLTFEPPSRGSSSPLDRLAWSERLRADSIRWSSLTYHKRPSLPATAYDIAVGGWTAARLARRHGYDVFHARAHVAAAVGALAKRLAGGKLLFDVRGFNPEEYVDAGVWAQGGAKFRIAKRVERDLLAAADGFIVLTEKAREILFPGCTDTDSSGRPIELIPCCVDLDRFGPPDAAERRQVRGELGIDGRRVIVYVGSFGGFYLTDATADFLAAAYRRDPSTFALLLSRSEPSMIAGTLERLGVPRSAYLVRPVPPSDVPRYLKAADLAVSFIKPSFSKQASSPTKIAEYLACGLPVVCNAGVGDLDALIDEDRVGVIVRDLGPGGYRDALEEIDRLAADGGLSSRCVAVARRRFDLETVGGERYLGLYSRLHAPRPLHPAPERPASWTQ